MSFFSSLLKFAKPVVGFLTGNSIGSQLTRTVLTGLALRKLYNADQKQDVNTPSSIQEEEPDFGVRVQASADTSTKIPVVYGTAFLGGKIIDVRMTSNNQVMYYCLALSEKTGTLLSTSSASTFTFKDIYYNNSRVVFKSNGYTLDYVVDVNGKIDRSLDGLVDIYCFDNGSNSPAGVEDFTAPTANAHTIMPNWTSTDTMDELAFIIVKITYNKEKNSGGLGNVIVKLQNSMTLPGDCLNDLMTNTRYGAGIDSTDIKTT